MSWFWNKYIDDGNLWSFNSCSKSFVSPVRWWQHMYLFNIKVLLSIDKDEPSYNAGWFAATISWSDDWLSLHSGRQSAFITVVSVSTVSPIVIIVMACGWVAVLVAQLLLPDSSLSACTASVESRSLIVADSESNFFTAFAVVLCSFFDTFHGGSARLCSCPT